MHWRQEEDVLRERRHAKGKLTCGRQNDALMAWQRAENKTTHWNQFWVFIHGFKEHLGRAVFKLVVVQACKAKIIEQLLWREMGNALDNSPDVVILGLKRDPVRGSMSALTKQTNAWHNWQNWLLFAHRGILLKIYVIIRYKKPVSGHIEITRSC